MHRVLAGMDQQDRARVEAVLSYPQDSAGGLMNTDTITVRPRHSLELVLRYLLAAVLEEALVRWPRSAYRSVMRIPACTP
jgi:Mg/Co/Ni transporter MgtE